jgi:hypothetical protein
VAKVVITIALKEEILRTFKAQSGDIFRRMKELEEQPKRGTPLGTVGGIVIQELKYGKFRFYFVTDGHVLKFGTQEELAVLLIKFVKMSEKKDQQKAIDAIKDTLRTLGFERL